MKKDRTMQEKKESLNPLVIFAVVPLCFCAVATACPPPECPDCYTWNGTRCVWDCSHGQTCCNDSCCDSGDCCNNDICCNSGEVCCTDNGSYCCPSGKTCCKGTCCESNQTCCNGTCCEPPVISSISGPDSVELCENAIFTANASDPDGTTLSYTWSGGGDPATGSSSTFTTKWSVLGVKSIQLVVTDNDNDECCGTAPCCDDKSSDIERKDVTVTLPSGCSDDTPYGGWEYVDFSGIGSCPADCTPDESDPEPDCCGNTLKLTCEPVSEYGGACAYEYWFNSSRVGLCVYTCGVNYFQVKKNSDGCRFLQTRHRTQDTLAVGCDEGTAGKYDWQVYITSDGGYCREGTTVGWEDGGDPSSCELSWW